MDTKKLLALLASLLALVAVPGIALAEPENEVRQKNNDAYVDQDEVISNEFDLYFYNGDGTDDAAWTGAACQLNVVGEAWVAAISIASALALIDDEDTDTFLGPDLRSLEDHDRAWFDTSAETSTSSCEQGVGPIVIFVSESEDGWGEAAPLGGSGVGGALEAVAQFHDTENEISQKDNDADVYQDEIISNDGYFDYEYIDGSAIAGALCQANVVGRAGVWAVSITSADGTVLDGDDDLDVITEPVDGVTAESVDTNVSLNNDGFFANLTIDNDHTATATCSQPIESITIAIGDREGLPPQS